ncbi:MAG: LPXTG cell wall anchor domain-containing protein [Ilumatobacteraceae bacterium]
MPTGIGGTKPQTGNDSTTATLLLAALPPISGVAIVLGARRRPVG